MNPILQHLSQIKHTASPQQCLLFETFFEQLFLWNKTHNLTRIDEKKEFMQKHLIDSLSISPYIQDRKQIIDVGSGAGFPGIILACINPSHQFTLIESSAKRCAFLRHIKSLLKLPHVTVLQTRVENALLDIHNGYILTRAFAPLNRQIKIMEKLIINNNDLLAMKGRINELEIEEVKSVIQKIIPLPLSKETSHRHLIYIKFHVKPDINL